MELAILISVNLLISFLVYVAFAVRFRMALEKERKNRIPRAFYDNLQMTIQYINTATNSVDEKTEAFYRLLLKSEELARRLEKANEEFEKNLKKSSRKRKGPSVPAPEIPDSLAQDGPNQDRWNQNGKDEDRRNEKRTNPGLRNENQRRKAGADSQMAGADSGRAFQASGSEQASHSFHSPYFAGHEDQSRIDAPEREGSGDGQEGAHMDRLLSRMQEDRIQFTGAEGDAGPRGYSNLNQTSPSEEPEISIPGAEQKPARAASGGFLDRLGGMVGRVLGINPGSFQMGSSGHEGDRQQETGAAGKSGLFDREVERMNRAPAFRTDLDSEREAGAGKKGSPSPGDSEGWAGGTGPMRKDYYVSGLAPDSSFRRDFYQRAPDGPGDAVSEPSRISESEAAHKKGPNAAGDPLTAGPVDGPSPVAGESERPAREKTSEAGSAHRNPSESAALPSRQEDRIARVQEFLESMGINLLDTTPQTRAVLIRELGSLGFEPPDIIRATRFPPSEVALVLDLPEETGDRRRRVRKTRT